MLRLKFFKYYAKSSQYFVYKLYLKWFNRVFLKVLQRKFEEFLKELGNHHYRITEVNQAADKLIEEGHTEQNTIYNKREEVNEAWHRLNTLAATR